GNRLDDGTGQRDARRHRQAVAHRVAQPDRLRPEDRGRPRLDERDDALVLPAGLLLLLHARTVTSPAVPSTRTRVPSAMRSVASRVPTTPGMPYSRATIAECESRPPLSVTIAPWSGNRMLIASVVDSVNNTSPRSIRSNSEGLDTRRAGPSYTPRLAASPRRTSSSCSA